MKILTLSLQAFGPYREKTTLDFAAALPPVGFFLIHGSTGAGKTTILDAICFALYGEASGNDRTGRMLRSDKAGADEETFVELRFRIGPETYRVKREPAYRHGSNKNETPAKAELWHQAGEKEELLASKAGEVTRSIERLLGFECAEFRQVVLLPQGEFRRFLMSDSKERGRLMQSLFHTEIYGLFEQKLKAKYDEVRKKMELSLQQEQQILQQNEAEDLPSLQQSLAELTEAIARQQQERDAQKAVRDRLRKQLEEEKQLDGWFQSLAESEKQIAEDQRKAADVESFRERLARAEKAVMLKDKESHAEEARKRASQAEAQAVRETQAVRQAQEALQRAEKAAQAEQDKAPQLEAARKRLHLLGEAKEKAGAAIALRKDWKRASARLEAAQQERQAAQQKRELARQKSERLNLLAREGQAFFLAQSLEEGSPCPVCGALHHPHPAEKKSGDLIPGEEELKQAAEALQDAEKRLQQRQQQESQCRAEASRFEGSWKQAEADLDRLASAADHITPESAAQAYEKAAQEVQAREQAAEQAKKRLEQARTDFAAKEAAAQKAAEQKQQGAREAEAAEKAFETARLAQGFATQEDYQAAFAGKFDQAAHRERVKKHLKDYDDGCIAHRSRYEEAQEKTRGRKRPDVRQTQAASEAADQKWEQMVEQLEKGKNEHQQKERAVTQILSQRKHQSELQKEADVVSGLAEAATAVPPHYRIHFQTYIQRSIFVDVMQSANARLRLMSHGRFEFDRGEQLDRRKVDGLELAVLDSYTGKTRPPQTLSGGESFLASLSLALGLADVVTRYAGGIRLETMFIDEGFGSLDADTVDTTMDALIGLQKEGGRLVGIISHVEELARRIPSRLEVVSGPSGSRAYFTKETTAE
jgi:exonuclease SbcC